MSFSVGSKFVDICDTENDINFKTWVLYPSIDIPEEIKIGPFNIRGCKEGNYAAGRFPLVIISHGGGGSNLLYRSVATHLAMNGYFVAMPEHYRSNRVDNSLEGHDSNLMLRTKHIRLVIDSLIEDSEISHYLDSINIFMIGHSIGGTTALSLAGAIPWSSSRVQVNVTQDKRVKAIILFAPAVAWFQHPDSFRDYKVPTYIFSAEQDNITPVWQAEKIHNRVTDPTTVKHETVKNAGHLSFLSPFPREMTNVSFPPSQDPKGFDRNTFHDTLKDKVLNYLNNFTEVSTIEEPDAGKPHVRDCAGGAG